MLSYKSTLAKLKATEINSRWASVVDRDYKLNLKIVKFKINKKDMLSSDSTVGKNKIRNTNNLSMCFWKMGSAMVVEIHQQKLLIAHFQKKSFFTAFPRIVQVKFLLSITRLKRNCVTLTAAVKCETSAHRPVKQDERKYHSTDDDERE